MHVAGFGVTARIQSSSSSAITATFSVAPEAAPGSHTVTVVTGGLTSNGEDFFVQVPNALEVVSVATLPTGTSGNYGCTPAMDFGIKVKVTYQVVDPEGQPISSADMKPQEEVLDQDIDGHTYSPVPEWKDIGPSRISGTVKFTTPMGRFFDAPLGICGDGPFHASVDQQISVLVDGRRYPLRAQNLRISSSAEGQGVISNSLDISRSRP